MLFVSKFSHFLKSENKIDGYLITRFLPEHRGLGHYSNTLLSILCQKLVLQLKVSTPIQVLSISKVQIYFGI